MISENGHYELIQHVKMMFVTYFIVNYYLTLMNVVMCVY